MDLGLKGKKAVITGGTRGIGRSIAELFAQEGCDVAVCARTKDEVEETVAQLRGQKIEATGESIDIADSKATRQWIDSVAKEFGGIDILIANVSALVEDHSEASWRRAFEVDMLGTICSIDTSIPHLRESKSGAIVAISSVSGLQYFGGVRAYNSIKAALINHVSNVAHEMAPTGIRANTISPGTIYFKGGVWHRRKIEQPDMFQRALAMNPTGRMGNPEEVAKAAVFIASPAASYITGANLIVDGALTQGVQY